MFEDAEGFRYPHVDQSACVQCGLCHEICPNENAPSWSEKPVFVFGRYHKSEMIREASTSGGAFSAIVDGWCDGNYVIFGAASEGLNVFCCYVTSKEDIGRFRKSKYSQSIIGQSYQEAKRFLREGKKDLFSGTPCQIAGLKSFLGKQDQRRLLTVEIVCEGLPSPLFVRSYDRLLQERYGSRIRELDYRCKDGKSRILK